MENMPSSLAEVKGIIEAVNLNTFTRVKYFKSDKGMCSLPFDQIEGGFKSLEAALDFAIWDAPDPDQKFTFEDTPEPTLIFERKPLPGEVKDFLFYAWRAHAVQVANPRFSEPDEVLPQLPRCDNVVHLPAAEKQAAKHNRPPRDVLKYASFLPIGEEWKSLYIVMYRLSWYGPLNKVGGYAGKSTQKGRYFTQGNKELAKSTGLGLRTVSKYLMAMKKHKLILQHKRGYKGQKCSIWEVPFDLDHVFAWKRSPKRSR